MVDLINSATDGAIIQLEIRRALDPLRKDLCLHLREPFDKVSLGYVRNLLRIHARRAGRHLKRLEKGNPLVAVTMQLTDKGDKPPWLRE